MTIISKTTSDNISIGLEQIDGFMDRYGLSCINNLVNCVTKVCMGIYQFFYGDEIRDKGEEIMLQHYWTYIDNKSALTCALGLVPVLGSVLIWVEGKFKNEKSLKNDIKPSEGLTLLKTSTQEDYDVLDPINDEIQEGGEIVARDKEVNHAIN